MLNFGVIFLNGPRCLAVGPEVESLKSCEMIFAGEVNLKQCTLTLPHLDQISYNTLTLDREFMSHQITTSCF